MADHTDYYYWNVVFRVFSVIFISHLVMQYMVCVTDVYVTDAGTQLMVYRGQPSTWRPDDGELKTPKHVSYVTNVKDNK
jgi:hypothetical protein